MAKEYFNHIHRKVMMNTGASVSVHNQHELDAFLRRIKEDLAKLNNYINDIVYPILQGPGYSGSPNPVLAFGPKFPQDVLEFGLSGMTIQTFSIESGNEGPSSGECYWWDDGYGEGRPKTIKETFDCILGMITDYQVLMETLDYDDTWIKDKFECAEKERDFNFKSMYGCQSELNCDDNPQLQFPILYHLGQIFSQVIHGHDQNTILSQFISGIQCDDLDYPDLFINLNSCDFTWDCCVELENLCTLCPDPNDPNRSFRDDFVEIQNWTGYYCGGTPDYSTVEVDGSLVNLCSPFDANLNLSLHDAIALTMHEVCKRTELAWSVIKVSSEGGGQIVGGDLTADERHDQIEFIAGPGIKITSNDPGGAANSVESLKFEALPVSVPDSILGDLNDAYHFTQHPPYYLGVITLESSYENAAGAEPNHNWKPNCVPLPGAGLYLVDDSPELQSKAFAIVNDFKSNFSAGPSSAYFSVGAHWASAMTDELVHQGLLTTEAAEDWKAQWDAYKVVHTEDSVFMMKQLPDTTRIPLTAGVGADHLIGNSNCQEGAMWISSGSEQQDACGEALLPGHLYYRAPGNGLIYRLSHCPPVIPDPAPTPDPQPQPTPGGGGTLNDAYNFDKDSDGLHDGGIIKLKSRATTKNRSFWLMQDPAFNTDFADYWVTNDDYIDSADSPAPDTNCPYYIPWFAITDYSTSGDPDSGGVLSNTAINAVEENDRYFSVQMRDQCLITESDDCCCDFDDPNQELLAPLGGLWNISNGWVIHNVNTALMDITQPDNGWPNGVAPGNFIKWVPHFYYQANLPNYASVLKGVVYNPGDCFYIDLYGRADEVLPVEADAYSFCLTVLQSFSFMIMSGAQYELTDNLGRVWLPLVVSDTQAMNLTPDANGVVAGNNPYLALDPDCLGCPCDYDDLTQHYLYPYMSFDSAQQEQIGYAYAVPNQDLSLGSLGLDQPNHSGTSALMSETYLSSVGFPLQENNTKTYNEDESVWMKVNVGGNIAELCLTAQQNISIRLPWVDNQGNIFGAGFTGQELIDNGVLEGVNGVGFSTLAVDPNENYWAITGPFFMDPQNWQVQLPPCSTFDRGRDTEARPCDCTKDTPAFLDDWETNELPAIPRQEGDIGGDGQHLLSWNALLTEVAATHNTPFGEAPGFINDSLDERTVCAAVAKSVVDAAVPVLSTIPEIIYVTNDKVEMLGDYVCAKALGSQLKYRVDRSITVMPGNHFGQAANAEEYYLVTGAPLLVGDGNALQSGSDTIALGVTWILAKETTTWEGNPGWELCGEPPANYEVGKRS